MITDTSKDRVLLIDSYIDRDTLKVFSRYGILWNKGLMRSYSQSCNLRRNVDDLRMNTYSCPELYFLPREAMACNIFHENHINH